MSPTPDGHPQSWGPVLANLGVQAGVALTIGLLVYLWVLLRGDPASAFGWGLVAFILGFWSARSLIAWPLYRGQKKDDEEHVPLKLRLLNLAAQLGVGLLGAGAAWFVLSGFDYSRTTIILLSAVAGIFVASSSGKYVTWPLPLRKEKPTTQSGSSIRPSETGGREVVETVVFVVVLVLLLKSFAAEAFVIPTGSMAETLYGYQKIVTCPSCGHEFPVNCSKEDDPAEEDKRQRVNGCVCPNCRRVIRLINPQAINQARHGWGDGRPPRQGIQFTGGGRVGSGMPYEEIEDPGSSSGFRVLVGKFLFDFSLPGLGGPNRHDVVVFKFPDAPQKRHVAQNYIKRLVGLPGETIGITGGDLYALSPEKGPKYDDSKVPFVDRWQLKHIHEQTKENAQEFFETNEFNIIRKPPRVLLSMMRPVYDNDHQAKDLKDNLAYRRWKHDPAGWEVLDEGRAFRHGSRPGAEETWLHYRHLLRTDEGKPSLITDFMGYNSGQTWSERDDLQQPPNPILKELEGNGNNWVGDLILECEVNVEQAEGQLTLELVRCEEFFRAAWDLSSPDGRCTLSRVRGGKEVQLESKPTRLRKGNAHRVRFANVDRRLTVWVDNELPFGDGVVYDAPALQGPGRSDLEPAGIGVKGASVTVQKVKLFRDTYFTRGTYPDDLDVSDWTDTKKAMDALQKPGVKTLYVQPGHYLCLGDNSTASSDGRSWGLVPERLLLGRALLVYYPFGFAGRIR